MKTFVISSVLAGVISACGCACMQPKSDLPESDMNTLGRDLTYLTQDVDATLRQDPAGAVGLSGEAVLARALAGDARLQTTFRPYKVTLTRAGGAFSLLVCTPDGARALLEDASCTPELDGTPWQQTPAAPCRSTLQLSAVCKP